MQLRSIGRGRLRVPARVVGGTLTVLTMIAGCTEDRASSPRDTATPTTSAATTGSRAGAGQDAATPGTSVGDQAGARDGGTALDRITVIAAGDVSFGRMRGQQLLRDPGGNDFEPLTELLGTADIRFVNLESQLSDQGGQTVSPINKLVFVGPPAGAKVLKTAGIDIVSLANNHAWDYGHEALVETLDHLDRAGVAFVGAGRDREAAYAPRIVGHHGFRVAFLAYTDIWNQGLLRNHPGKEHVADARHEPLLEAIRKAKARPDVAAVAVSYHGGDEYYDTPHEHTRKLLRAAIEAGADVVLGHHPHVLQRVELVDGKPVFYSLGNLLMRMTTGKPWTEWGALARVTLRTGLVPRAEICPYRIHGMRPVPLAGDPFRERYEAFFRFRFGNLLRVAGLLEPASEVRLGEFGADGCAPLEPRSDGRR